MDKLEPIVQEQVKSLEDMDLNESRLVRILKKAIHTKRSYWNNLHQKEDTSYEDPDEYIYLSWCTKPIDGYNFAIVTWGEGVDSIRPTSHAYYLGYFEGLEEVELKDTPTLSRAAVFGNMDAHTLTELYGPRKKRVNVPVFRKAVRESVCYDSSRLPNCRENIINHLCDRLFYKIRKGD